MVIFFSAPARSICSGVIFVSGEVGVVFFFSAGGGGFAELDDMVASRIEIKRAAVVESL